MWFALFILAAPVALYFLVIRPKGAHILATYREAGGGWSGVSAVLWGFQTWFVALLGAVAYALPDVLTALSGVDWKSGFPEPWGGYVSTTIAVALPLLRAFAATPTGKPPSGEA